MLDHDRANLTERALRGEGYRALICRLPEHVLMFTGYLPVLGNAFCIVSLPPNGGLEIRLAVPKDERPLVPEGAALEVKTFAEETMESIQDTIEAVRPVLADLLDSAGLSEPGYASSEGLSSGARTEAGPKIGYEGAPVPISVAYTQVGIPGPAHLRLLGDLLRHADLVEATSALHGLSAIKTPRDLTRIRRSVAVAVEGFEAARRVISGGTTEAEVAAAVYGAMLKAGHALPGVRSVQPHVHVMAGARAAEAYKAFNVTSDAPIRMGETVLVQMEIGIDGYWAELTRTFFAQTVDDQWRRVHEACLAAQRAALPAVRKGASAKEVDARARAAMKEAGFGSAFKHGLGHGIGFQAINHMALPRLHPASSDGLRRGMVHNMEPAAYIDGVGGFRLNDNVAVTANEAELLSEAVPRDLDWLVVSN